MDKHPVYDSFILRIWQEHDSQNLHIIWRFSLENINGGERMGFSTLSDLCVYLHNYVHLKTSAD